LPQIDANGMVMMSINTSISEKSGDRVSADGKISVPVLNVRESNNVVLSRSGQTIVIGGLMKTKTSKKKNSVPMLGDIPFFGQAFQHEADVDEKTELVIMLTPEVMAGLAVDDQLNDTQSEIKRIGFPSTSQSLLAPN
jgi:type II secretory pathway component GspD/PulD (secretin)